MKYYANYASLEAQIRTFHEFIKTNEQEEDEQIWSYEGIFTSSENRDGKEQVEIISPEYGWKVTLDVMENLFGQRHTVITMNGISIREFREVIC